VASYRPATDVALRVCPANKTGEHTLEPDKPWESASLNWFSVADNGGKYRMWYEAYDVDGWPTGDDTSFCYAESADGVHWRKPDLGLFRYRDVNQTNILFRMIGPPDAHSRVLGVDDRNEPIPGRSLEDCLPIEGDRLAATVKWKDGSGASTREAVPTRLAFRLKNASLYTLRFTTPGNETD
jgi:hypothetical protein